LKDALSSTTQKAAGNLKDQHQKLPGRPLKNHRLQSITKVGKKWKDRGMATG